MRPWSTASSSKEAQLLVVQNPDPPQDPLEVRRSPLPVPTLQTLPLEGAHSLYELPDHLLGALLRLRQALDTLLRGPLHFHQLRGGLLELLDVCGQLAHEPRQAQQLLAQEEPPELRPPLRTFLQEPGQAVEVPDREPHAAILAAARSRRQRPPPAVRPAWARGLLQSSNQPLRRPLVPYPAQKLRHFGLQRRLEQLLDRLPEPAVQPLPVGLDVRLPGLVRWCMVAALLLSGPSSPEVC